MRFKNPIIIVLPIAAVMVLSGWRIARMVKASIGYNIQAEFAELPENDDALTQWLKSQPGVVESTVHVERRGNEVHVMFIISRDLLKYPPIPKFDQQCLRLGYKGPNGPWVDVHN